MSYHPRASIKCVLCGDGSAVGRKLCRPCYNRMLKEGRLKEFPILGPSDVFESRIKKTPSCWLWQGTKNGYGYGIFLMPGERPVRAHRYAYEFFVGKIPKGKIIMHSCDNPPCVNPKHLRIGTKDENNKDTAKKRRHHYGLDHWNGRLSDEDLEYIRKSDKRQCDLASQFGVTQSHISRIRSGKARK